LEEYVTEAGNSTAFRLLLTREQILASLGHRVRLQVSKEPGKAQSMGSVVAAAAPDSAYRSYAGTVPMEDSERPIAVACMALVFDGPAKSEHTFSQVAAAAHLRTKLGDCNVAVETVTSATGLVSYWGFLQLQQCMIILTLDTVDPHTISMTDFRALVSAAAEHMQTAL
jgi:hypothetical protein